MTCGDVEQLLDAFIDAELPSPMMLAVARHAAGCASCEGTVRQLTELRERLVTTVQHEVESLPLAGVWHGVAAEMDRGQAARGRRGRLRAMSIWGTAAAMAASLMLWVGGPVEPPVAPPVRLAARSERAAPRPLRNLTHIDRLAGKGVSIRREPKAGTTIIWVNHSLDGEAW
jgi:hypothetical protein